LKENIHCGELIEKWLQLKLIELETGVEVEITTKTGEQRITRSNDQNKTLKCNMKYKLKQKYQLIA